jgi:hypothetical protein
VAWCLARNRQRDRRQPGGAGDGREVRGVLRPPFTMRKRAAGRGRQHHHLVISHHFHPVRIEPGDACFRLRELARGQFSAVADEGAQAVAEVFGSSRAAFAVHAPHLRFAQRENAAAQSRNVPAGEIHRLQVGARGCAPRRSRGCRPRARHPRARTRRGRRRNPFAVARIRCGAARVSSARTRGNAGPPSPDAAGRAPDRGLNGSAGRHDRSAGARAPRRPHSTSRKTASARRNRRTRPEYAPSRSCPCRAPTRRGRRDRSAGARARAAGRIAASQRVLCGAVPRIHALGTQRSLVHRGEPQQHGAGATQLPDDERIVQRVVVAAKAQARRMRPIANGDVRLERHRQAIERAERFAAASRASAARAAASAPSASTKVKAPPSCFAIASRYRDVSASLLIRRDARDSAVQVASAVDAAAVVLTCLPSAARRSAGSASDGCRSASVARCRPARRARPSVRRRRVVPAAA